MLKVHRERILCHFMTFLYTGHNCYWFTCEYFISEVLKLGKGALNLVGLAKMCNTKYSVNGKLHNAMELIALYEGNSQFCHNSRRYKCHYIALRGKLEDQPVRIFLIRYVRNQRWNVLLSTDLCMSFVRAFEHRGSEQGMQAVSWSRSMCW